jgi:predicted DNA-binding ArsR family transcriptional regulator
MMDIAQHIRIFDKTPSDELVEKRTESINALSEKYSKLANVTDILDLAADLTRAVAKSSAFPDSRATEVEAVIREKRSSGRPRTSDSNLCTSCGAEAADGS